MALKNMSIDVTCSSVCSTVRLYYLNRFKKHYKDFGLISLKSTEKETFLLTKIHVEFVIFYLLHRREMEH